MLETIREYGLERLAASGEEPAIRERHAASCLGLAERAEPALLGPDQIAWLDRLEAELPNLRAALAWLRDAGDAERGLRLAAALWTFWVVRDRVPEGRRWLETFLATGAVEPAGRTRALVAVGDLAERQGDYAAAVACLDEAVALARARGDRAGEAAALRGRGNVAISRGEVARHRLGDEARAEEEFARAEALLGAEPGAGARGGRRLGRGQGQALARRSWRSSGETWSARPPRSRTPWRSSAASATTARSAWSSATSAPWPNRPATWRGRGRRWPSRWRWPGGWGTGGGSGGAWTTSAGWPPRPGRASARRGCSGRRRRCGRRPGSRCGPGCERVQAEILATIRSTLGEAATAAALAAGAALPLDEAIAEALAGGGAPSDRHAVGQ